MTPRSEQFYARGREFGRALYAIVERIRAERGLTLADVAELAGVSRSTLQKLPDHSPNIALVFGLAAALKTSAAKLWAEAEGNRNGR